MPSIMEFEIIGIATNGAPSTTVLQMATATFQTQRIQAGDTIYNITDGQTATISTIDSETQLTCTALSGGASWNSSDRFRIWVTDTRAFKFHISDTLDIPMAAEITIADPGNGSEKSFSDYQKVRIKENSTSLIVFSGKIEKILSKWDTTYGQVLEILARDNLAELLKRTANSSHTGFTRRSALIADIIGDYVYAANNINMATADFQASVKVEGATVLDTYLAGAGKNVLRAVAEIAQSDPWSVDPATGFGYDLLLDTDFTAMGETSSDLWYFRRGSLPAGGALANGLTVQYAGVESAQVRSMLIDYGFITESRELVTRARIEYVTPAGASTNESVILVNHGAVTGGPFQENEVVSWGANSAIVKKVGTGFLLLAENSASLGTWLNAISGLVITGGTSLATATVGATTASPPGSLREVTEQDSEIVLREYDTSHLTDARNKAAEILYHGGDTILRGDFTIIGWPSFELLGVDYLVRTGHVIRVINSNAAVNSDMLVTHIGYDEGPGMLHSRIEVMGTIRGKTVSRTILEKVREEAETATWQTIGSTGGLPESAQLVNIDFVFTTPAWNQFAWAGVLLTATYSDGSTQTINTTGSPYTIADANIRYIYIIAGTATLQVSTSFSDVIGATKSLLAIAKRADVSTEDCKIVSMNQGSPVIAAGTIIANELSAITGNMGLLTTGGIKIPSGTVNTITTALFTGFTLNGDRIAGYNAGVLQTELRSSDGRFYAGAGNVILDTGGITIKGVSAAAGRLTLQDSAGANAVVLTAAIGDLYCLPSTAGGHFVSVDNAFTNVSIAGTIDSDLDPDATTRDIGDATLFWDTIYGTTLYIQDIRRRSGAGGDIGTATSYFNNLFIGQPYNKISGNGGNMEFYVKAAGAASVLAMYIDDGATPIIYFPDGVNLLAVGTSNLGSSTFPFAKLFVGTDSVDRYISGANGDMEFYGNGNRTMTLKDENAAANTTNVEIRLNSDAGVNVALVTLGAFDSGGAGYRLLRVPN